MGAIPIICIEESGSCKGVHRQLYLPLRPAFLIDFFLGVGLFLYINTLPGSLAIRACTWRVCRLQCVLDLPFFLETFSAPGNIMPMCDGVASPDRLCEFFRFPATVKENSRASDYIL